jgi:hypothetical protein
VYFRPQAQIKFGLGDSASADCGRRHGAPRSCTRMLAVSLSRIVDVDEIASWAQCAQHDWIGLN